MKNSGHVLFGVMIMIALGAAGALPEAIDLRWTFGAHEPYTMYRRVGRHCTGGIDGNARWLKPWLDWWDAESPKLMRELGLNALHSRFYKGMGWEEERKDFPNVRKFVRNCHAHGITALAYVQFSTLYYETLGREIPDLETWAQVNEHGEKNTYGNQYFRWMPCMTCEAWVAYLERMCTIALTEGGFDGIMFDNVFVAPCYCARCERLFNEYVRALPDPAERFGFDDLSHVRQPRKVAATAEVRDPVVQAWCRWRTEHLTGVLMRLREHIRRVKPDAIVSGNPHPYRFCPSELALTRSLDMLDIDRAFDVIIMQSANFPEVTAKGAIANRVRELKMGRVRGKTIVALCDSDAMVTEQRERHYLLPLLEDAIFGGVPTDRTIMSPRREPGFVSQARLARRKPQLAAYNAFLTAHRGDFTARAYTPVKLFYPVASIRSSPAIHAGLVAAEELLMRRQVPWSYALSRPDEPFRMPSDGEVLILPSTVCLSDAEIAALRAYAQAGGRLLVTGEAGRYDDWNAERFTAPCELQATGGGRGASALPCGTACLGVQGGNVVCRDGVDLIAGAKIGWSTQVPPPPAWEKTSLGAAFDELAARTHWRPACGVVGAPAGVLSEVKRTATGYVIHILNYNPDVPAAGMRLIVPPGATRITCLQPFEPDAAERTLSATDGLPGIRLYARVSITVR